MTISKHRDFCPGPEDENVCKENSEVFAKTVKDDEKNEAEVGYENMRDPEEV